MAKPFYSIEEVCAKLGKTQEDVKSLVRDGSLREFRDAGKVFFKAEDVDRLSRSNDTGEITLDAADDDVPTIASTGGTSIIGLEPVDDAPKKNKKEDTVITASGIGVFDEDELEIDADPMAKTQITSGAVDDQVQLESAGSGSGLLDLTREADDTSLGAELLDEIYPGEDEAPAAKPAAKAAAPKAAKAKAPAPVVREVQPEDEMDSGEVLAPVIVDTGDPLEGMFGGLLFGSLVLLTLAGMAIAGALGNAVPGVILSLSDLGLIYPAIGVGVLGFCLLVGWLIGRAGAPKRIVTR